MPDGTYRETVRHPYGALELDLMYQAWRVWDVFIQKGGTPKDKHSRKFMGWLMKEPGQEETLNAIVSRLWGIGDWSTAVSGD